MEKITVLVALAAAAVLALVHIFAGRVRFLESIPRNRWLSAAGGVSVAYVFLHLIPGIASKQKTLADGSDEVLGFIENPVFLVTLAGLVAFYGLERMAKTSRRESNGTGEEGPTSSGVFWIHTVSFSLYNFVIGYLLLHLEEADVQTLILFSAAMALHFFVNDYGLREHHKDAYHDTGRWIIAASVLLGFLVGYLSRLPEHLVTLLTSFIAGGIILNVLKEELPEERKSSFSAFLFGVGAYAALLLAM